MKILLVEDETAIGESVAAFLTKEGYICEWAQHFNAADDKIGVYEYDCALIALPGGSGLDIVKDLKKMSPNTGIIIISAKNSLGDKVSGLDLGADDYLTKPFHLAELNSRIKSLLRRRKFEGNKEIIAAEIKIIPDKFTVFVNDRTISLTKKEYDLLLFFISNKNRVLTKEAIAEHLWGDQADVADSFDFVYTHLKNLRKKILDKGGEDHIKTIYGIGYKFQIA
jgi:DNA-binding response OmpR family regulator